MTEDSEVNVSTPSKKLSRKMFLGGLMIGAVTLTANSLLGERFSGQEPEIEKIPDTLSEYKIPWKAKPWVWINLAIASRFIDGVEITPGKEISLIELLNFDEHNLSQETTDPRKGYIAAQMPNPSELGNPGCGLCLAATAIFRGALESPLQVTECGTHFDPLPAYFEDMPMGTDAAIFIPGPEDTVPKTDLKLRNPTDKPIKLFFRVFDESGFRLEIPDGKVTEAWYKASLLTAAIALLRGMIEKKSGKKIPEQYFPEHCFGNRNICVQVVFAGREIEYSVDVGDVTSVRPKGNQGGTQYTFSRNLIIEQPNGTEKQYKETFTSQYMQT